QTVHHYNRVVVTLESPGGGKGFEVGSSGAGVELDLSRERCGGYGNGLEGSQRAASGLVRV
ncbi:hypothetical protein HDU96_003333, partial [Phlyctochytrium bullatum]